MNFIGNFMQNHRVKLHQRCEYYIQNYLIIINCTLTPISSTNILSKPTGPRELLTMLAMELAAITVTNKNRHINIPEQKKKKIAIHLFLNIELSSFQIFIKVIFNILFLHIIYQDLL